MNRPFPIENIENQFLYRFPQNFANQLSVPVNHLVTPSKRSPVPLPPLTVEIAIRPVLLRGWWPLLLTSRKMWNINEVLFCPTKQPNNC